MATLKTLSGRINSRDVREVRIVSLTALQSKGGFVGRTVVGAVIAGPVGAIIGAATRKTTNDVQVAFEVTFNNGRTEHGVASQKAVTAFAKAVRGGADGYPEDWESVLFKRIGWVVGVVAVLALIAHFGG